MLPPREPSSGFWAASERNGWDAWALWTMASEAMGAIFAMTPGEIRDFLDGPAGRILADDLAFIEGGPTDAEAIETLIRSRLHHVGWRRLYEYAIAEARGQTPPAYPTTWPGGARRAYPARGGRD